MAMGRGKLTVSRKAHQRKSFIKDVERGPGVTLKRIPATTVKGSTFTIEDRGAPGKGPKLIPIKHPGKMTAAAKRLGYIREDMRVTDIPSSKMDDFARALAREVGAKSAFSMFQAQVNFRKRATSGAGLENRRKFEIARDAVAKAFPMQLTPTAAIRTNLRKGENPRGRG